MRPRFRRSLRPNARVSFPTLTLRSCPLACRSLVTSHDIPYDYRLNIFFLGNNSIHLFTELLRSEVN